MDNVEQARADFDKACEAYERGEYEKGRLLLTSAVNLLDPEIPDQTVLDQTFEAVTAHAWLRDYILACARNDEDGDGGAVPLAA
jgi:hypothetical protein